MTTPRAAADFGSDWAAFYAGHARLLAARRGDRRLVADSLDERVRRLLVLALLERGWVTEAALLEPE